MKTIHQYQLESDKQVSTLALRDGYRIVRCEYVVAQKRVYLWVEEPVSYNHVDTALDPFGPQAFHVYEVIAPAEATTSRTRKPFDPLVFGTVERQHA